MFGFGESYRTIVTEVLYIDIRFLHTAAIIVHIFF